MACLIIGATFPLYFYYSVLSKIRQKLEGGNGGRSEEVYVWQKLIPRPQRNM
jgi:hypothetical protein